MARPRSDIQPRIVEAARGRFLAHGVEGASLREIARDARTSIGMVVYYFPTKDDLFLAVVEEVYAGMLADLTAVLDVPGPARDRLRAVFLRLGKASDRELEVIRLVVREALSSSTRLRRIVARFMRGHVPLLLQAIQDGIREGELDTSVPLPAIVVACFGLGALPQIARRAAGAVPLFAGLPGAEKLADLSMQLIYRAVGAVGAPPLKKGRAR
jgi:AcrR family transcriptional regulator